MRPRAIVLVAFLLIASTATAAPPRSEAAAIESLTANLDLERRGRVLDIEDLDRITDLVGRAATAAASARGRLVRALKEGDVDLRTIEGGEEDIAEAEARLHAAEDRRRTLAARISERSRRITLLVEDINRRRLSLRTVDPISGRWETVVNPGGRKGVFRLALDGTLISGDFVLDSGFRGSLRGTFVGDKVTLQRIDSESGLDATFYAKVNRSEKTMKGSWEATALAPATGPTAGTWVGVQVPDRDEGEPDKP